MIRLAILDDYNHVALRMADWSRVQQQCQVDVIDCPLKIPGEAAEVLAPYDILCHLRERTAMPRALIERLSNLKMMTITGHQHRTLDVAACTERGILVCHSADRPGGAQGTPELTFGLMLACARKIAFEDRMLRSGQWQSTIGFTLSGKTLGIVGLGKIGRRVAEIARAFRMEVMAWSPNLTPERAAEAGVRYASREELFARADIVTMHMVLSDRTRGLIGAADLARMKPNAWIINTSRGPLIDERALLDVLQGGRIGGAGLDVYHEEPLLPEHPLLKLDNTVLTPHLGYVVEESFRAFYEDTVEAVEAWIGGAPVRPVNPEVLG